MKGRMHSKSQREIPSCDLGKVLAEDLGLGSVEGMGGGRERGREGNVAGEEGGVGMGPTGNLPPLSGRNVGGGSEEGIGRANERRDKLGVEHSRFLLLLLLLRFVLKV